MVCLASVNRFLGSFLGVSKSQQQRFAKGKGLERPSPGWLYASFHRLFVSKFVNPLLDKQDTIGEAAGWTIWYFPPLHSTSKSRIGNIDKTSGHEYARFSTSHFSDNYLVNDPSMICLKAFILYYCLPSRRH